MSFSTLEDPPPLCVDLDGTLSKSDTLWDSIILLFSVSPILVVKLFFFVFSGKAAFKSAVARTINWENFSFVWDAEVVEFLHAESLKGRRIILATGAHAIIAAKVLERFSFFSDFLASSDNKNLTGKEKAAALVDRFGPKNFDYLGNDMVDVAVWRCSRKALLANCDRSVFRKLKSEGISFETVSQKKDGKLSFLRALRPHQWVKNFLVFTPLFAAHMFTEQMAWLYAIMMFSAYCLTASSFYLFNDIMDVHADRKHPVKHKRPFANGEISPTSGFLSFAILLFMGIFAAHMIPDQGALISLMCYIILNASYTLYIKSLVLLDVVVLGLLYTVRIISGGLAVGATPSSWLLAFSAFLFLSLGLVKRYSELTIKQEAGEEKVAGRGYFSSDSLFVFVFGLASGLMAVLVLALYVNSSSAYILYSRPVLTWAVVPAVLFWISRIWLIAWRQHMNHDPVVFAVKDLATYCTVAFIAVFFFMAI